MTSRNKSNDLEARAREARTAIQKHLNEVEIIPAQASRDGNFDLARQRLSRWRSRVEETLSRLVDPSEGERFAKTRKSGHLPSQPMQNLVDDTRISKGFLQALAEELERNPSDLITNITQRQRNNRGSSTTHSDLRGRFDTLHPKIKEKCEVLYESRQFAEAVEKSFKIVRDRLRELTTYETGAEAFGKGKLRVKGAAAPHVEGDFNDAVKFLTMAIDKFRNEKSHTSDAKIDDPNRAFEYLTVSSLALNLLERADAPPLHKD